MVIQHCERNCSLLFLKKQNKTTIVFALIKLQEEKVYRDTQEQSGRVILKYHCSPLAGGQTAQFLARYSDVFKPHQKRK